MQRLLEPYDVATQRAVIDAEITEGRDLREACPLWMDTPRISVAIRKAPRSLRYDVIVVGVCFSVQV